MLNLEIKFFQVFLPSGLLPNDVQRMLQPGQSSVIRPDDEFTSEHVLLELLEKVNYSQKFLTRSAVVPLRLVVCLAGIGDHAFLPSLDLRHHGSNGVVADISVKDVKCLHPSAWRAQASFVRANRSSSKAR